MTDLATIGFRADTSGLVRARGDLDKLASQGERTEGRVSSAMGGIGRAFAVVASAAGIGTLASKLIDTERSTGILTASLKIATGSADNASEAFGAIQRLATQLPESVDSVSNAFIKLTNLGLDPSESAIKSYSNTAAAMGKDLNQMIEAVADAATGEFERLKEFGIKSKQQGDQVSFTFRGVTTTVKKESEAITGYLRDIGDVTFAGASEERMKTLDGAISNLGDTWDGLFRTINSAGVGEFIADAVRMASSAVQSFSDFIESGQASGAIEAFAMKFDVVRDVAVAGFNTMIDAVRGFYGTWYMISNEYYGAFGASTDSVIGSFVDGFINLPENIKAFIQIAVVEIAAFVDKAAAYGTQLARNLNPVTAIKDAIGGYDELNQKLDIINSARQDSIIAIMDERQAAIDSFGAQVEKIGEMSVATENAGEVLGKYGVKAQEAADSTAEIPKQLKAMQDVVAQNDWDELFQGMEGYDFTENIEAIDAQRDGLDALIESVDNFGGAWSNTGNTIADALGSMADQMDNYISRMAAVEAKEIELAEAKKKAYSLDDIAKITAAEKKMATERTKANLSGYRTMASAAASMFSENSKGRRALTAIDQAMTAVELALSLKRGLMAAKEAVVAQGKGDPVTAFARMAAMAAAVAALGFAVGGGGGGGGGTSAADVQDAQGTGSVLGSNDKSESMLNAMESFQDTGLDQLAELRGIRENLATFSGGIERLSMSFATSMLADKKYFAFQNQNFGHAMNVGLEIGGSKKEHIGMRLALLPMQDQITDVLGFMSDTIASGVQSLGLNFEKSVGEFWINIGKVSFKDMSGEEINEALSAIFSQQADLLTEFVVPAMGEYQLMGEGLFETLMRVAKEQAVFNDTIKNIGIELGDLSAIMRIDVAQSVIQLMGGLDEFSEKTSEYLDAFFSDSEKMDMLTASLSETFSALNLTVPQSRDEFRNLIEGIDLTTDAGQRMFANLMELVPGIDEYITGLEKAADAQLNAAAKMAQAEDAANKAASAAQARIDSQRNSLEIQMLQAQGKIDEATARRRELELAGLDESLRALQGQIHAQQDANAAMAEAAKLAEEQASAAEKLAKDQAEIAEDLARAQIEAAENAAREQAAIASEKYSLESELMRIMGDTAGLRERELLTLDESNRAIQKQIWATEAQKIAADELSRAQIEAAESASRAQIQAQEDATRAAEQAAEEQRRLIEGTQDAITAAIRALRGESEQLNDIDRQRAKNTLNAALAAAHAGKSIIGFAGLENALMAVQNIDKSQFASAEAYQREVGQTLSILDRLGGYAGIAPKTPIPTTSPVIPMGTVTQAQTTQQLAVNVQNMEAQMIDLTKRIEKNTKTNADMMQRWEAIGMPATRA